MSTQAIIMFPYSGYDTNTEAGRQRERIFWEIINTCRKVKATGGRPPIIILNRDTENRHMADAFLADPRAAEDNMPKAERIIIRRTWSVDTCQMWLSGWGKVLDTDGVHNDDRIIQLPGDIDTVSEDSDNDNSFFHNLETFISMSEWDLIIGDFTSGNMYNAKELIDWYGTYALMANWFPEIARQIRKLPLHKPRSEFLNIRVETLKELLDFRKFAYEQTLNMIIRSWDFEEKDWKYGIKTVRLGTLKDDSKLRQYRDCLDQIERTERMLRLLWREICDPQQQFIDEYDRLDRLSTSIRENSRIIIRNLLGVEVKTRVE
jgi:hypothetical protein